MALSVHETLKAMRELLSDEKRWTQGATARNSAGVLIGTLSADAVCWDLGGAWTKVNQHGKAADWSAITDALDLDPVAFNDTHTHAEVLAKLDDAIKATAP